MENDLVEIVVVISDPYKGNIVMQAAKDLGHILSPMFVFDDDPGPIEMGVYFHLQVPEENVVKTIEDMMTIEQVIASYRKPPAYLAYEELAVSQDG